MLCFAHKFQDAADVVLAAVKQDGRALKFASNRLKSDTDIVMAAVNQNACALEYVAEQMQSDANVVSSFASQVKLLCKENVLLRTALNATETTVVVHNVDTSSASKKRKRSVEDNKMTEIDQLKAEIKMKQRRIEELEKNYGTP